MRAQLSLLESPPAATAPFEIVERKGVGHPDTICDALTEGLSHALCRFYIERFGLILHHNVDKALLWGGAARPAFGGGEVLEPIEIYIAGRATRAARGVTVPVDALAIESSRAWLRANLPALDPERHVRIHALIRPSSPDLVACYLLSQIGKPIDAPQVFDVKLRLADPDALASLRARIEAVAHDELAGIHALWTKVLAGECPVW